jgi:hypothetical protein
MEEEEVQRDPRAGSTSLVEEAQVRYTLLLLRFPISKEVQFMIICQYEA